MFGRRDRAALDALDPLHRTLIEQHTLSASLQPDAWRALGEALVHSHEVLPKAKHRVPPRTLELVVPIVRVLVEDLGPNGWLGVTADLRGPDAPGKRGPRHELPAHPPARKVVEELTTDGWLATDSVQRDGSRLQVQVADIIRQRTITKRSQSGKTKIKRATKATQRATVHLTLPKGVAVRPSPSTATWLQVRVKEGKRARIVVKATYPLDHRPPAAQLQAILTTIGEAYRCVARPVTAGAGEAGA